MAEKWSVTPAIFFFLIMLRFYWKDVIYAIDRRRNVENVSASLRGIRWLGGISLCTLAGCFRLEALTDTKMRENKTSCSRKSSFSALPDFLIFFFLQLPLL